MEDIKMYNKSGILTGQWDSYCLVCKTIFKRGDDILTHINSEDHISKLNNCKMVEGSIYEFIRKLSKGYYCEKCNCVLFSRSQLKKHVNGSDHNDFKISTKLPNLKINITDSHVEFFNCLKIDINAWNIIIDSSCMLCKIDDVADVTSHLQDIEHIIRMIENEVVRKKYYLYRKIIDSKMYHCLTCNLMIPKENLLQHMHGEYHDVIFKKASHGLIMEKSQKNYDINEQLELDNFLSKNKYCLVCTWNINDDEKHVNNYHHKNMVNMHWKWIDRHRKFVILGRENETLSDSDENETNKEEIDTKDMTTSEKDTPLMAETFTLKSELDIENNIKTEETVTKTVKSKHEGVSDNSAGPSNLVKSVADCIAKLSFQPDTNQGKVKSEMKSEATPGTSKEFNKEENSNVAERNTDITESNPSQVNKDHLEVIQYGREYCISHRSGRFACDLCNIPVVESIEGIRAHVMAPPHKKDTSILNYKLSDCQDKLRVESFQITSDECFSVARGYTIYNRMFCMSLCSFNCFIEVGGKLRCFLCHQDVNDYSHANIEQHKRQLGQSLIIKKFEKHFVREISKDLYHCGKCNMIFVEWTELLLHLVSTSHKMQHEAYELLCLVNLKIMTKKMEMARHMMSRLFQ